MARPKHPNPPQVFGVRLPPDLIKKVRDFLWSDVEKQVPRGDYEAFFSARIRDFFNKRDLDLAPYLGTLPGECVVSGTDLTLSKLINRLKEAKHAAEAPAVAHSDTLPVREDLSR